jgi:parallel beta-helix repeat protein
MYNGSWTYPTITNCMFTRNSGSGMYNLEVSFPTITNCTFTGNLNYGMTNFEGLPRVINCILWGDTPNEFYNQGGSATVTYSNVEGGHGGEGNIDADPLFTSYHGFDYLLHPGSPCIDSGDPTLEDGFDWPDWYANGLRSDMGAYGGPGNVGWLY